jgi:hypothetical protein
MDRCRETAFCVTLWYAVLTVIVAALAIALHDLDRPAALLVAANVALLFALVLIVRAGRLTDINITRGQFWRALPARQRPRGEAGARIARRALHETWLRFAKGAAMVAIVLSGLAYASNGADQAKAARADGVTPSPSQSNPVTTYRVVRLLPTN